MLVETERTMFLDDLVLPSLTNMYLVWAQMRILLHPL